MQEKASGICFYAYGKNIVWISMQEGYWFNGNQYLFCKANLKRQALSGGK
jgi:hypothetical protein